jgi:hypothetical protein
MKPIQILALVLILAGVLGLVYREFSYTKERHDAKVGSLSFTMKEKETVNIPVWASVSSVVAGTALLIFKRRK